jgi:hypothetical protein
MNRLPIIILSLFLFGTLIACGNKDDDSIRVVDGKESLGLSLEPYYGTDTSYNAHLPEMPDDNCVKLHFARTRDLRKEFNDSNYVQLIAARELGIKPIESLRDVWNQKKTIVKIKSCREYYVDELTHSYPYLVPEAAELLKEIGKRFNDSLRARGGGYYRLKVTSLLRTRNTVGRLRRVNRNATDTSAHQFATTFDIAYNKFIYDREGGPHRTAVDLKGLLTEILQKLHNDGRCYVKYEVKQACFHITTRPQTVKPKND